MNFSKKQSAIGFCVVLGVLVAAFFNNDVGTQAALALGALWLALVFTR